MPYPQKMPPARVFPENRIFVTIGKFIYLFVGELWALLLQVLEMVVGLQNEGVAFGYGIEWITPSEENFLCNRTPGRSFAGIACYYGQWHNSSRRINWLWRWQAGNPSHEDLLPGREQRLHGFTSRKLPQLPVRPLPRGYMQGKRRKRLA